MQLFHALHLDHLGARAAHLSAHSVDKALQILDFRLSGRVMDGGDSRQQGGGHDNIFGGPRGFDFGLFPLWKGR